MKIGIVHSEHWVRETIRLVAEGATSERCEFVEVAEPKHISKAITDNPDTAMIFIPCDEESPGMTVAGAIKKLHPNLKVVAMGNVGWITGNQIAEQNGLDGFLVTATGEGDPHIGEQIQRLLTPLVPA